MTDQYEYDLTHLSSAHSSHDGRHLVEVKQTPEKGLGIFARVRISRGTRIVAEAPLLKATAFSPYGVNVQEPFDRLSSAKQRAYLELHEHASETLKRDNDWESLPELNRKVLAIYAANSFGKDVFWLASRFNHACIPNIHNAYNPVIQMDIFHSIREIEAGEELTVSYTSGFCVRGQRKAQLNKWGFQCRCSACKETPDGNKLEQQLVRLALLSREPGMAVSNILPNKNTLKMHQKMAAIMCSAGFVGKSLHQQYLDAAFCSAVLGDVQMAVLWTEKEVGVNSYCLGQDHPDYQKEMAVLSQLRSAAKTKKPFHFTHIRWVMDWDEGPE